MHIGGVTKRNMAVRIVGNRGLQTVNINLGLKFWKKAEIVSKKNN